MWSVNIRAFIIWHVCYIEKATTFENVDRELQHKKLWSDIDC